MEAVTPSVGFCIYALWEALRSCPVPHLWGIIRFPVGNGRMDGAAGED
ncbi:hypothetical protein [Angelakisella massiliensis]|nr:hypothetical protein [Angelakisella massiliensis]